MDKIKNILENFKNNIPQALVRLNDGECQGILEPGCTIARGDQNVSKDLSKLLLEALQHEQENYWVGLPCSKCNTGPWYEKIKKYVNLDYKYLTKAVVNTNRNLDLVVSTLPTVIDKNTNIIWVSGSDQNIVNLRNIGLNITDQIIVPTKDAWSIVDKIKSDIIYRLDSNKLTVVFLSIGPTSRVLAYQLFKDYPQHTFIDIGSTFDPQTRNVWYSCHLKTLNPCSGCN